jgi:predicted nucleic acid-binding protein
MKTKWVVVDSSYILDLLFPDEGKTKIRPGNMVAPRLLVYEVVNAIKMAIKRERIEEDLALALLAEFEEWRVELKDVELSRVLDLALKNDLSVYDASYLYLAKKMKCELLTWDRKLRG